MWLCTAHPCRAASAPSPCSSAGVQVGTKRGVMTGRTSVDPRQLHCQKVRKLGILTCYSRTPGTLPVCAQQQQQPVHASSGGDADVT